MFYESKSVQQLNFNYFKYESYFNKKDEICSLLCFGKENDFHVYISIVIPAYNKTNELKRAVMSCINQKECGYNFEIVVVDDTTRPEIKNDNLQMIRNLNNSKVRYYQNRCNLGTYDNWNRCITLAHGEYIILLHTDDWLYDDYLSVMCPLIKRYPDIDWISVRPKDKLLSNFAKDSLFKIYFQINTIGAFFPVQCAIFKKKTLIDIGGFSNYSLIDDLPFKKKMSYLYSVYQFNHELYKQGSDQTSNSSVANWQEELIFQYHYDLCSIQKREKLLYNIFKYALEYSIIRTINALKNGNNYTKRKFKIDENSVFSILNIKMNPFNILLRYICYCIFRLDFRYWLHKCQKSNVFTY